MNMQVERSLVVMGLSTVCVFMIVLSSLCLSVFLTVCKGEIFGVRFYGEKGLHLSELVVRGGLEDFMKMSQNGSSSFEIYDYEVPAKIRSHLRIPDDVTDLYLSVLYNEPLKIKYCLEQGPDMNRDGNILAISLLPLSASSDVAELFRNTPYWDGLKISVNAGGDSPAILADKLGEGRIRRILEEIESRPMRE